jgi:uncharacterized membrane protein SpoIIM required for sporulation
MNADRFVADRAEAWAELDSLLSDAGGRAGKLEPEEIHRLGALYRSAAADLALANRAWPDAAGTIRLQSLVIRANAVVYSRAGRNATAGEFLGRRLWQEIRALKGCLALSAAFLFGSVLLGVLWGAVQPSVAVGLLPAGFHASAHSHGSFYNFSIAGRGGLAVAIFVNNIEVSVLAMAGGLSGGLLTAVSLSYNGAIVGVLGALEWRAGGLGSFLSLVLPHGLLELSCITLAGAAGFAIAKALIDPGMYSRSEALTRITPMLGSVILGVMMFLVVAGTTEGIVTPWDLPTPAAPAVGLALAGAFWAMVLLKGAPAASASRTPGHRQALTR